MQNFIQAIPKAELHLHIEGTIEPEMLLSLSKRNNIKLKYQNVDEIKRAYQFNNLSEFLDLYYQGMEVLITEEDYFDLTYAYLKKAKAQNITYAEIFFDPQAHVKRGIKLSTVINGISRALDEGNKNLNVAANLIMCFIRDLSEKAAIEMFDEALIYRDKFIGIGLDSTEIGNPPQKFKNLFNMAHNEGLKLVAHAGEEGPVDYIWEAIDILGVDRIDHGVKAVEDKELIHRLKSDKIGLTMCPLSNLSLKIVNDLKFYPVKQLLDQGVLVTINSDDPAYLGGYVNENYLQLAKSLNLTENEIQKIATNSFEISFNKARV